MAATGNECAVAKWKTYRLSPQFSSDQSWIGPDMARRTCDQWQICHARGWLPTVTKPGIKGDEFGRHEQTRTADTYLVNSRTTYSYWASFDFCELRPALATGARERIARTIAHKIRDSRCSGVGAHGYSGS